MIELRTGLPGACKTLSMVKKLSTLQKRWENKPEESRAVFIHGIADLLLPHSPLPLTQYQAKNGGVTMWVPDWDAVPDGSLVIIDEAQGFFPPRSSQSTPPPHVSFLNTHRHKGLDIWVTTQHPKLIDSSVRALIGKHEHFRRVFGGNRSICYEFDACNDSLNRLSSAVTSYFPFPKDAYKFYKSAEVHTKQTFKLPAWLLIPFCAVALGVYFIPKSYGVLNNGISGRGISTSSASEGKINTLPPVVVPQAPTAMNLPSVGLPVAPVTIFNKPVVLAAACVASERRCQCYTHGGVKVDVPADVCRKAASYPYDFSAFKVAGNP